jgi:hypothetical protein
MRLIKRRGKTSQSYISCDVVKVGRGLEMRFIMAIGRRRTWRELCRAALDAKSPEEVLLIVQELSKVAKREEEILRDFKVGIRNIESTRQVQG